MVITNTNLEVCPSRPAPRRPPAPMILDDTEEEEDPEEGGGASGSKDSDEEEDQESGDENESNKDLQALSSVSLKKKMASEVCNLLKLRFISELNLVSSVVQC
jgi:hypothetical protein